MKKIHLIFSCLVIISFLFGCKSCKEILPPTLSVTVENSSNIYSAYENITCNVNASSEVALTRLIITPSVEGYNKKSKIDTIFSCNEILYNYKYTVSEIQEKTTNDSMITITFKIIQEDGQEAVENLYFNIEILQNEEVEYSFFDLFSFFNANNNNCFCSIENNETYNLEDAPDFAEKIDFAYFFNDEDSVVITSPDDGLIINFENGTASWNYRKQTRFKKTYMDRDEFNNIHFQSDQIEELISNNMTETKITKIESDEVIAFKNNEIGGAILINFAPNNNIEGLSIIIKYVNINEQ